MILAEISADMTSISDPAHLVQTAVATGLVRGQPAFSTRFRTAAGRRCVAATRPGLLRNYLSLPISWSAIGHTRVAGAAAAGSCFAEGACVAGSSAWRRCAARKSSTMRSQS